MAKFVVVCAIVALLAVALANFTVLGEIYATSLNLHQHTMYIKGSFDFDTSLIKFDEKVDLSYSIAQVVQSTNGDDIQTEKGLKIKYAQIQVFQSAILITEGELSNVATKTDTQTSARAQFPVHPFGQGKLSPTTPLHFFITHKLESTPEQLKITAGSVIKACFTVQQGNQVWHEHTCVEHTISPAALYQIQTKQHQSLLTGTLTDERIDSGTQTAFRSFCNGQTPPEPTLLLLADDENTIQPGCSSTDSFHINAYGLRFDAPAPTLAFQIGGHATIKKNGGGVSNPYHINCRVNTHFVDFIRSDQIEDEKVRAFYPEGQFTYVARDVSELGLGGVLELECVDTGLHYPIHYTDPTTQDRVTTSDIRYETFIHITLLDGAIFNSETIPTTFSQQPSFTIFFNNPAILSPVDIDIHSTSSQVAPDDKTSEFDLHFFGSFYLTGEPNRYDEIQICPIFIAMDDPLQVLITQANFNTTTKKLIPDSSPIPLYQSSTKKSTVGTDDCNFIPQTKCFGIKIFEQFPWRARHNYTQTPQVFRFSMSTKVSGYSAASAIYTRYVSYGSGNHAVPPTGYDNTQNHMMLNKKPTWDPVYIYAATPLPRHKTSLASTILPTHLQYNTEDAEQHSTYSAKFDTIVIDHITSNLDRVAMVLAGNHYLDGDIQCYFDYTGIDGEKVEDYISAKIDKTVQSARMVTFDLENPLDFAKTISLELKCIGMFATSDSASNFRAASIFHLYGRNPETKEFTLSTTRFIIDKAETAPQPVLPTTPDDADDDDDDDKKKASIWKVLLICGAILGVVAVIWFIATLVKNAQNNKKKQDPLLGEGTGDYVDIQ